MPAIMATMGRLTRRRLAGSMTPSRHNARSTMLGDPSIRSVLSTAFDLSKIGAERLVCNGSGQHRRTGKVGPSAQNGEAHLPSHHVLVRAFIGDDMYPLCCAGSIPADVPERRPTPA